MTHYKTETLDLRLMDCMELMRETPDKFYDLAVVDPPYGIMDKIKSGGETNRKIKIQKGLEKFGDIAPDASYFQELFRVSQNQIIWGANYFPQNLNHSRGWIVWDKKIPEGMSFAMCELAYSSFNTNAKIFKSIVGDKDFHPTQKPVALYRWIFANYAKPGMRILDTHLGSASSAIAAHYAGVHLTGCELDPDYFAASIKRVIDNTAQLTFDL